MRDPTLYLKDILEAMEAIERFVEGMEFEDFKMADKTSSAVIRKFEIIGEATKNVPETIKQKYPIIPWRDGRNARQTHSFLLKKAIVDEKG